MPTAILEQPPTTRISTDDWDGWELPAGGLQCVEPCSAAPELIYRGIADPHLFGQPCAVMPSPEDDHEVQGVVFACGCRAVVPWSTLDRMR
jgi:hypothetical protein